jgi:hypothetical protein
MIFDPKKELDKKRAVDKINHFIAKGKVFELTEKKERRSIQQNSYMHLIFSWFALETGYTEEEVKQEIFKKIVNANLFYEGEHGQLVKIERWRSTSDLDTGELTVAIDRFRNYASKEAGIYLPEPKDLPLLRDIEIEIQNNKQYL